MKKMLNLHKMFITFILLSTISCGVKENKLSAKEVKSLDDDSNKNNDGDGKEEISHAEHCFRQHMPSFSSNLWEIKPQQIHLWIKELALAQKVCQLNEEQIKILILDKKF